MDERAICHTLSAGAKEILEKNILPFWSERMPDTTFGGFYGRIDGENHLHREAEKGAVLHARILWFFSAVYRITGDGKALAMADRAKDFLLEKLYDPQYGGLYWAVDFQGNPTQTKKQIYALGFGIYGLSEYFRATGNHKALWGAVKLFESIETFSYDDRFGGYIEAVSRSGKPLSDLRLSQKDANEPKSMNTHLHILEPYTNLYRVWKDEKLKSRLQELITLFLERIISKKNGHLHLFFDNAWQVKSDIISYGHDIEASWLLHEAALVLGEKALLAQVEEVVPRIAKAAEEGLNPEGGLRYEFDPASNRIDEDCHWWVQAESVIGFLNLYQHFGDSSALMTARNAFNYIQRYLIDSAGGEWFWSRLADGNTNRSDDKAGFWKCPYHNGRMCLEILERFPLKTH